MKDETRLDLCFNSVAELLDEAGIEWWLEAGSLLGAIRNGGRIDGDPDYDLGFHVRDTVRVFNILQRLPWFGFHLRGNFDFEVCDGTSHAICLKPHKIIKGHMCKLTTYIGVHSIAHYINNHSASTGADVKTMRIRHPSIKYFSFICSCLAMLYPKKVVIRGTKNDYKEFIWVGFQGRAVRIPIGAERVLIYHYGDDYMTPKKKGEYEDYPESSISM